MDYEPEVEQHESSQPDESRLIKSAALHDAATIFISFAKMVFVAVIKRDTGQGLINLDWPDPGRWYDVERSETIDEPGLTTSLKMCPKASCRCMLHIVNFLNFP